MLLCVCVRGYTVIKVGQSYNTIAFIALDSHRNSKRSAIEDDSQKYKTKKAKKITLKKEQSFALWERRVVFKRSCEFITKEEGYI